MGAQMQLVISHGCLPDWDMYITYIHLFLEIRYMGHLSGILVCNAVLLLSESPFNLGLVGL